MLLEPAGVIDAEVTQQLLVLDSLIGVQTAQCNEDPLRTARPDICLEWRLDDRSCCSLHSNAPLRDTVTGPISCHMLCAAGTLHRWQQMHAN